MDVLTLNVTALTFSITPSTIDGETFKYIYAPDTAPANK